MALPSFEQAAVASHIQKVCGPKGLALALAAKLSKKPPVTTLV